MRCCLFSAGLALISLTSQAGIVFGPVLQDVRTDRITVVVETDGADACEVQWGAGFSNSTLLARDGLHHEGVVAGLDLSTCYPYRVDCSGNLSAEASFCSAAAPGEPFSFVVFGDTRSNHADHRLVAEAIRAESVDFFLNTGDLVSNGERDEDWPPFFEAEAELLREIPLYPAVGNHDEENLQLNNYTRLFALPTDSSGSERFYAFTYGNARFIVLDNISTLLLGPDSSLSDEQGDWFKAELNAAEVDPSVEHVFVFLHENMYSVKDGRSGDGRIRLWRNLMLSKGVDFVFSGHDHYYCRGEADNGLPFAVSGGGGAGLYDIKPSYLTDGTPVDAFVWDLYCPLTCPFTVQFSREVHHFIRVDIHGDYFNACAKDAQGNPFDCWSYGEVPVDGGVDAGQDGDGGIADGGDPGFDAGVDGGEDGGPDPCDCTGEPVDLVCGEDGITYDNLCEADCAQVGVDHFGQCQEPDGGVDGGADGGLDAGADGDLCNCVDQQLAPVCGEDGQTYANLCLLDCAGIAMAHEGECVTDPGECTCSDEDVPVCGVDGRTYKNACLLACMEIQADHQGACKGQNDCGCSGGADRSAPGLLALVFLILLARRRLS